MLGSFESPLPRFDLENGAPFLESLRWEIESPSETWTRLSMLGRNAASRGCEGNHVAMKIFFFNDPTRGNESVDLSSCIVCLVVQKKVKKSLKNATI